MHLLGAFLDFLSLRSAQGKPGTSKLARIAVKPSTLATSLWSANMATGHLEKQMHGLVGIVIFGHRRGNLTES